MINGEQKTLLLNYCLEQCTTPKQHLNGISVFRNTRDTFCPAYRAFTRGTIQYYPTSHQTLFSGKIVSNVLGKKAAQDNLYVAISLTFRSSGPETDGIHISRLQAELHGNNVMTSGARVQL